ncbi:ammonium transporter [Nocardia sp. NPDC006630]|uniref:ammonium transporter n=1 Tax=Nocardia sp. NPDC006630 TaxID=3157181 RepID=UPI0033AA3A0D
MMLRKITAVAAPIAVAVAIAGAGVAHADSAVPDIGYQANLVGNTVVTTLTNGRFELTGSAVNIKDTAGNTLVSLPLSFEDNGTAYPLTSSLADDSHTLSLTAVKNVAAAYPVAVKPVASPSENLLAMQTFSSQFGIATAIGGLIGTALGALVGLSGIVAGPTVIASVIAGAAVGGIIGTLVVGGPALLIAGIDLVNTLVAAPGTTKYNDSTVN